MGKVVAFFGGIVVGSLGMYYIMINAVKWLLSNGTLTLNSPAQLLEEEGEPPSEDYECVGAVVTDMGGNAKTVYWKHGLNA